MNIILTDKYRESLKDSIKELETLCPDTIRRKIPRANVQQAFVLSEVKKHFKSGKLLAVGCYEDTACESLVALKYPVTAIDPNVNMDLNKFFNSTKDKFSVIFSTSVIEHVQDDNTFIDQICKLLDHNGVAILTCDFREDYAGDDNKPGEDYRLYTSKDILFRFANILKNNNCSLIGDIDYSAAPDFEYGIYKYSFATFMFRKQ